MRLGRLPLERAIWADALTEPVGLIPRKARFFHIAAGPGTEMPAPLL
jgi:hypothetical protein